MVAQFVQINSCISSALHNYISYTMRAITPIPMEIIIYFRNIKKVLLTNDLTEDVAVEAYNHGCEMIVSYHPPIFAPLKSVVQR